MAGPTNDEGPSVGALGLLGQVQSDKRIFHDTDAARKALATLQARAALAGYQLHELGSGELLLTRWGLAKSCPDLYSAGRFLDQVTGVR